MDVEKVIKALALHDKVIVIINSTVIVGNDGSVEVKEKAPAIAEAKGGEQYGRKTNEEAERSSGEIKASSHRTAVR